MSEETNKKTIVCWNCEKEIAKEDRFCRYCGKEQKNNDTYLFEYLNTNCWKCGSKIERKDKYCKECGSGQDNKAKFPYTLLGILLQFLVIGPFVMYRLYKTPLIDKSIKQKVFLLLTIITLAAVFFVLYAVTIIFNYYKTIFTL